jgi:hypothetical protein
MLVKFSINVVNSGNVNVNLNVILIRWGTLQICPFLQQEVKENEVYVTGIE